MAELHTNIRYLRSAARFVQKNVARLSNKKSYILAVILLSQLHLSP